MVDGAYVRRSWVEQRNKFYQHPDSKLIRSNTNSRNARYLYISKNGILHPVINETTVAVHAGYMTLIGLGFLSVLNTAAKQMSSGSSSSSKNDDKTKENDYPKNSTKTRKKRKRPYAYPYAYTYTTLPPIEPYDDIGGVGVANEMDDYDAEYEEELRQYEKDYEQYVKDYAEWNKEYGDLYRNAESSTMVATSSRVDSSQFRFKPNTRKRKQRYMAI
jgi:hypothetical protein